MLDPSNVPSARQQCRVLSFSKWPINRIHHLARLSRRYRRGISLLAVRPELLGSVAFADACHRVPPLTSLSLSPQITPFYRPRRTRSCIASGMSHEAARTATAIYPVRSLSLAFLYCQKASVCHLSRAQPTLLSVSFKCTLPLHDFYSGSLWRSICTFIN